MPRDYHYLDCKLISVDRDLRKYVTQNLIGFDNQSKIYANSRLALTERQYMFNLTQYKEIFNERRLFLKQLIRSKRLKRILMIVMSKNSLPKDSREMKALVSEFHETFQWKVMQKMDEIERARNHAAVQKEMKRLKKDLGTGVEAVKMIQEQLKISQRTMKTEDRESEGAL